MIIIGILILLMFLAALAWLLSRITIGRFWGETTSRAGADQTGPASQGFDPPQEQGDDAAEFTYSKAAQISAVLHLLNPH